MNTMSIQIHPGNLPASDAVNAWVKRRLTAWLRRFAPRITRVEVHFGDVNGPKHGAADRRCAMEVRVNGRKPIAVEHRAGDLYVAIDGAAKKLRRALARALDRVDTRRQRRARQETGPGREAQGAMGRRLSRGRAPGRLGTRAAGRAPVR